MQRVNSRLVHGAVALLAAGLVMVGLLGGTPGAIQAASQSTGYWPAPAAAGAGLYYDKPAAVPGSIPVVPAPVVDATSTASLATLAASHGTSLAELAWANQIPAGASPHAGQPLLIPPSGPAVLVRVLPGEDLQSFAARFRVSTGVVLNYNNLSGSQLAPDTFLLMPRAASPSSLPVQDFLPMTAGVPEVTPSQPRSPNPFPWGQCTYWVASQRSVPWQGNAIDWWAEARAYGVPEGLVPVAGAIAVYDIGYYGHVAYVTKVLANGSWQQTEMNVYGLGVEDTRTMVPGEDGFLGFIY